MDDAFRERRLAGKRKPHRIAMICVILAPGESMSRDLADSVRHLPTIVVSNAYELRPDAMALVANDAAWWRAYQQARTFAG